MLRPKKRAEVLQTVLRTLEDLHPEWVARAFLHEEVRRVMGSTGTSIHTLTRALIAAGEENIIERKIGAGKARGCFYRMVTLPNCVNSAAVPPKKFPHPAVVTVWTCSDGRDFLKETEALWYELELEKAKKKA